MFWNNEKKSNFSSTGVWKLSPDNSETQWRNKSMSYQFSLSLAMWEFNSHRVELFASPHQHTYWASLILCRSDQPSHFTQDCPGFSTENPHHIYHLGTMVLLFLPETVSLHIQVYMVIKASSTLTSFR